MIVQSLKQKPMFRYFEESSLEKLIESGSLLVHHDTDVIIREGEVSPDLYIIIRGSVNVTVSEEGRDVFICAIGEGEFFGEAGIFSRVKRTANVVSGGESVLLRIDRKGLLSYINRFPETGIKLLMIMVFSLLRKLREVNQELAFERKYDVNQDDIDSMIRNLMEEQ